MVGAAPLALGHRPCVSCAAERAQLRGARGEGGPREGGSEYGREGREGRIHRREIRRREGCRDGEHEGWRYWSFD